MSSVIPSFLSTIAAQVSAHPLEVAAGAACLGGLTVVACKVSMKIQRFVAGFFGGMCLAALFIASQLAKVSLFVKADYNIPAIALTILGSGFLGGFGMLFNRL